MQIVLFSFNLIDHHFVDVLWSISRDHVDTIHVRVGVPIDTVNLLDTDSFRALVEVANDRQRFFDALDLLQPIDVSRIEIGGRGGELNRAGPHKDQFRADVRGPTLQLVWHTAREARE